MLECATELRLDGVEQGHRKELRDDDDPLLGQGYGQSARRAVSRAAPMKEVRKKSAHRLKPCGVQKQRSHDFRRPARLC